ncbi:hypothetical protein [Deinococcus radiotolerans]|uniref:LPS-assembly protein LptD n=1 Tax=Deinococcus radiotolerans TaxID=1309407 RepID=A0ABQ2FPY5_9DEIO|nr:hypothetical protein [Deinococcus radiotolerans]GGL15166.1 hypothetical protein GCM10010844_37450 [Deinococcus radiotolerans]
MRGRASRPARRRSGRLKAALLALGLLALGGAQARTVKIVSADTLELRQVDGQELVIISGENVELRVDDDVVRAKRVEFNRTRRTLTLIGSATYHSAKDNEDLRGENLVVELGKEQVSGEDVLISDARLQIRGQEVDRIPGQLRATGGYFTTCARCGRTPNDYAFRADRLIVYPGDRLVAYNAQLLLADVPVLFLPVLVLPLNDKDRQPRLEVGRDAVDGLTVLADLPFSVGGNTLGTTRLRYYENRNPSVGLGVNLRSYAPVPFVDRVDLDALAEPRPVGQTGRDVNLDFRVRGRVPLTLAVRDLDYSLSVTQRDIGRSSTDAERGVTNVQFSANVEYPLFSAALEYVDRFGPKPTTALSPPLKRPEVTVDPKPYTNGPLSADVRVTAGSYTAASNPRSPSATAQGVNITTSRLEEQHALAYTVKPWTDADLSLSNTFTGRYYGTGARTVQLNVTGTLTQRWAGSNSVSLTAKYLRTEGTSPFAFDALSGRVLSAPITLNLTTVPARDVTFGVSYTRDLFLRSDQQGNATFSLGVNRKPLSLSASAQVNPDKRTLEDVTFSATLADPDSAKVTVTPAQPATATAPARPATATRSSAWPAPNLSLSASGGYALSTGPKPLTVTAAVTGDVRSNTFSVSVTHALREPGITSVGFRYNLTRTQDTVVNALSATGDETLNPATGQLSGSHRVLWRGQYEFRTAHNLLLTRADNARSSGTLEFSVGTTSGSLNSWSVKYGGPYDLRRGGFTAPQLTGSLNLTRPGQNLAVAAAVNLPGLDQRRTELVRAELSGAAQFGSRFWISGRALYTRTRSGTYPNDRATDTLQLDPLRVSLGLGRADERPGAYLTGTLRQSFTWLDGVRQSPGPLTPVLGLTIDRCCWALQAEADLVNRRYRVAVGLPGQTGFPLFELTPDSVKVPLIPALP